MPGKSSKDLDTIIDDAMKYFVPGYLVGIKFHQDHNVFEDKEAYAKLPYFEDFSSFQQRKSEIQKQGWVITQCPRTQLSSWTIDASEITGTPFIAISSPRPRKQEQITAFLTQLFLEKDITHLYACGNKIDTLHFINWFTLSSTPDFTITHHDFTGNYNIEEDKSWTVQSILTGTLKIQQNTTKEIRELFVTVIPMEDNIPIAINDANANIIRGITKESKDFKTHRSIVHCQAGLGRTGTFILAEEICKHARNIFAPDANSAMEIIKILLRIRINRESLVFTEDQFKSAIRLGHYAYSQDLILESKNNPQPVRATNNRNSLFSDAGTIFLEGLRQIATFSILYFMPFFFIDYTQPSKNEEKSTTLKKS